MYICCLHFLYVRFVSSIYKKTQGYVKQFRSLQQFLMKQSFWDSITLIGQEDRGVTGNFEIFIGHEKQLIHSKKTANQGRCTSPNERTMLVDFINEYLDE